MAYSVGLLIQIDGLLSILLCWGLKERLLLRKRQLYTDCTDFNRNFEGIAAI